MVKKHLYFINLRWLVSSLVMAVMVFPAVSQNDIVDGNDTEVELSMTLDEAIGLAKVQSLSGFRSKNMYLARYWEFRSFKADRLPILSLHTTPVNFDRSVVNRYDSEIDAERFIPRSYLTSNANLSVRQNLPFSGGVFDVTSSLSRIQNLEDDGVGYASVPVSVGFTQPLNGYNRFRWESRIEPLKFEKAKKEYVQSLETLAMRTTSYFFGQITAEINLKIAETNFSNADTLYRIGKGRFEIGTVTQDELLDLELGLLNARLAVSRAQVNLKQARASLNSFLMLDEKVLVSCVVPDEIPELKVSPDTAMAYAMENNPELLDFRQRILEAGQNVSRVRSESGLSASVRANMGINKNADELKTAYQDPFLDQQQVRVSLNVPIIDWGLRKGKIQMARSNQQVIDATVKQERIDFEQDLFIRIMEFNMQEEQVKISAKADTIAQMGYDVTKQRFLIDKVDVIRLNSARTSLDAARRNYISSLKQYWNSYFEVRKLTLYNFVDDCPLVEDLDKLLQH